MIRRALASFLAVVAVYGAFTLSRVEPGVTVAELVDAGFAQCPAVDLACDVRASDEMLAQLEERGADAGRLYRRIAFDARDCRGIEDAGFVITDRRFYRDGGPPAFDVIGDRCRIVAGVADAGDKPRELPLECGCRMASGVCRYQLTDGGTAPAPFRRTLGPGYPPFTIFSGAGCARKACEEFAGDSSWPEVCPR